MAVGSGRRNVECDYYYSGTDSGGGSTGATADTDGGSGSGKTQTAAQIRLAKCLESRTRYALLSCTQKYIDKNKSMKKHQQEIHYDQYGACMQARHFLKSKTA